MPTILLLNKPENVSQSALEEIRTIAPHYDIWIEAHPEKTDLERLKDVEISVGGRPPSELFSNPNYKWHNQNSAGVDWLFHTDYAEAFNFTITNVVGMHATQMTEQAFSMILTFARDMHRFYPAKANKEWIRPRPERIFQLQGKTMLIVGVGAIGSQVAKIARAHDMRVIGIRRNPEKAAPNINEMRALHELDTILPHADIVVSILPGTPGTENIFAAQQFERMKMSSILINIGRGIHVNEADLAKAIRCHQIAGAGLDTFAEEPLPSSSELWDLEDVIITPHTGGFRNDYLEEALTYFRRNLKRYVSGKALENVVNPKLGY